MRSTLATHGSVRVEARGPAWTWGVLDLLDERHLCAWSDDEGHRRGFVRGLVGGLCGMADTEVWVLDGRSIDGLEGFCRSVETALQRGRIERDVESSAGVFGALRTRAGSELGRASKRRYIVWSEAHVLLNRDPRLFGRLADALMGTAAENELVGEDLLLIQRVVFVGRAALDVYAEDERGQFRRWYSPRGEMPLWRRVTGQARPHVCSRRVEAVQDSAAA